MSAAKRAAATNAAPTQFVRDVAESFFGMPSLSPGRLAYNRAFCLFGQVGPRFPLKREGFFRRLHIRKGEAEEGSEAPPRVRARTRVRPTGWGALSKGRKKDMNQLNSILIEGNLTKDPTFKETTKGTPLCTFAVASNRYYKSGSEMENEVSYFDVETWSKLADTCGKQLKKGRGVRVVGRLKQERWKATDGTARSSVKIVIANIYIVYLFPYRRLIYYE
jgi:single-strand DNA-binding protein